MMNNKRFKVKESVTHQDIGGEEFIIEMEVPHDDVLFKGTFGGNWACRNFLERRPDFQKGFPYKTYYGKVGFLGYIMSEDELEEIKEV